MQCVLSSPVDIFYLLAVIGTIVIFMSIDNKLQLTSTSSETTSFV